MKILILTPHVFAGGAEKAILNLAYHLDLLGCDTSIATLSLDLSKLPSNLKQLDFILPDKLKEPPRMNGIRTTLTSTLGVLNSLVKLLKSCSSEYDIVCACNFPAYWATYLAKPGKPIVWISSEVLGPYNQTKDVYDRSHFFRLALGVAMAVDKRIVNNSVEPIVTCSKLNSRLIRERYGRAALVLPTGVDCEFFDKEIPDAKAHWMLGDAPLLLHVGALIQRKNQILSIRSLKILKQRLGAVKLFIVGEGPWKGILQKEAKELGLEKDVVFTGSVSEYELRSLYHACDVNLFPVKDQTWGLVPFEALAAGKLSIVAEGCGAAEIIGEHKIGYLISPAVEELADMVLFALKNPELGEDMVKRGRQYVRENLTWGKYAEDMYRVFRNVLSSEQ
jgi:glycosyltransferase involved in cell wall biosynthesis